MRQEIYLRVDELYLQVTTTPEDLRAQLEHDNKEGHLSKDKKGTILNLFGNEQMYPLLYDYRSDLTSAMIIGVYIPELDDQATNLKSVALLVNVFTKVIKLVHDELGVDTPHAVNAHWFIYQCELIFATMLKCVIPNSKTYTLASGKNVTVHDSMYDTPVAAVVSTVEGYVTPKGFANLEGVSEQVTHFFNTATDSGRCWSDNLMSYGVVAVKVTCAKGATSAQVAETASVHLHELLHHIGGLLLHYEGNLEDTSLLTAWEILVRGVGYSSLCDHLAEWSIDTAA